MKFRWSNEEFLLTQQNTVLDDDTLYVHHAGILQAFQDHFYVVAHDLSIEVFEDFVAALWTSFSRIGHVFFPALRAFN